MIEEEEVEMAGKRVFIHDDGITPYVNENRNNLRAEDRASGL